MIFSCFCAGGPLKGMVPDKNNFFIMCFYAIMHRTTIVQNKILSILCSCFFCEANIYRPGLGKVRLGRPNPKLLQPLNFYLRRKKKHSTQNCMHNNGMMPDFQFWFSFIFKKIFKMLSKKPVKIMNYIYNNYSLLLFF